MDNLQRHTFHKAERLCSRKTIEALFAGGNRSFSAFPLRVVCMPTCNPELPEVQVLISVSKRRFKHAVDRNRVKRQVREAYRLNKDILTAPLRQRGEQLALAFLWLSSEHFTSKAVTAKVVNLLQRVAESLDAEEPMTESDDAASAS